MIEGDFTVLDKVLIWLFKKLGDGIGPDIVIKVERILDDWFGPEIVTAFVADLSKE